MAIDARTEAAVRKEGLASTPSPRRRRLAVLGLFLVLAFVLFGRTWIHPTTRTIGLSGDPGLYIWFLKWMPYALAHGENPFFTTHLAYPVGVNLMWNTLLPLPALLLAPVTVLLGPAFSYNLMVTVGFALSGWCAFLALRRFVASDRAALIGALVYGFGPYMITQGIRHGNLVLAFLPPLFLVVLDEIIVRQRRSFVRMGVALGVLAATQIVLTEEMLASSAVVAALGVAWLAILHRDQIRSRAAYALRAFAVGTVTTLLLSGGLLAWQFAGPGNVHGRIHPVGRYVSDLLGFVFPTRFQMIAPGFASSVTRQFTGGPEEFNAYLGIPLIALLVYVARRYWGRPLVRWSSLMVLSVAIASLGPRLHVAGNVTRVYLPWKAVAEVPVAYNMLPARLMLYADLFVAVLVALFIEELVRRRGARRAMVGWLAVAIALLPLLPRFPYPSHPVSSPRFFTSGEAKRIPDGSVVLVAPFTRDSRTVDPMVWQALAGMRFRMPEGYIIMAGPTGRARYGPAPTSLQRTMVTILKRGRVDVSDAVRRTMLAELSMLDVQTIVVGPMRNREQMRALFTDLLGRPPEASGGVYVWWDVAREDRSR